MQSHTVALIGYAMSQVASSARHRRNAATFEPVGAEQVIHVADLRNRWTVTVGHDRLS
jgi:hypothetical protein